MNIAAVLASPLVYRLGWSLIHSAWQGAAAAAVLAVAFGLLSRRSAQARYLAACIGLTAVLVCGVATFLFVQPPPVTSSAKAAPADGVQSVRQVPGDDPRLVRQPTGFGTDRPSRPAPRSMENGGLASPTNVVEDSQVATEAFVASAPAAAVAEPWPQRVAKLAEPCLPWLVAAWLLGVGLLGIWRIGGLIAAWRLTRIGTQSATRNIEELAIRVARRLGIRRAVRVVQSLLIDTPMVVGWLRPVILLPLSAIAGLSGSQLEAILAHELAHIRRHDYSLNLLQSVVETLLFYHPAVWWMSRRLRVERERCCDDVAVQLCGDRIGYAEALAAVETTRAAAFAALAAGSPGGKDLIDRVGRVLGTSDDARRHLLPSRVAVLAIAGLLVATIGLSVFAESGATSPAKTSDKKPGDVESRSSASSTAASTRENSRADWMTAFGDTAEYQKSAVPEVELVGRIQTFDVAAEGHPEQTITVHNVAIDHPWIVVEDSPQVRDALVRIRPGSPDKLRGLLVLLKGKIVEDTKLASRRKFVIGLVRELKETDADWQSPAPTNLDLLPDANAGQIALVAACQAVGPAQSQSGFGGMKNARQRFELVEVFHGEGKSGETRDLPYSYPEPIVGFALSGRDIRPDEKVIWVVSGHGDGQVGYGAVPDTPLNRKAAQRLAERLKTAKAASVEMPTWDDFQKLLGKPIDSALVRDFAAHYGLGKYTKFDEGGFSGNERRPFSLLYRRNRIDRVIVRTTSHPDFPKAGVYTGTLPHGVKWEDTPEDVIRRLGKPDHQPERDYLAYDKECLTFSFDRQTHRLSEVDLDAPEGAIPPPPKAFIEMQANLPAENSPEFMPNAYPNAPLTFVTVPKEPAREKRRDVSIVSFIELDDKDDVPSGLYAGVPVYPKRDIPTAQWIYERAMAAHKANVAADSMMPELCGRLAGVYGTKGTLEVAEQFVEDTTITIRLRYISEEKDVALAVISGVFKPPYVLVHGDKPDKSVYLWGEKLPGDLRPGTYTVNVELDEYLRQGDKLVFAPKTDVRRHERLSCKYTVAATAAANETVNAGDKPESLEIHYDGSSLRRIDVADGRIQITWHTLKPDEILPRQSLDSFDKHTLDVELRKEDRVRLEDWVKKSEVSSLKSTYPPTDPGSYSAAFSHTLVVRAGGQEKKVAWDDTSKAAEVDKAVAELDRIAESVRIAHQAAWGKEVKSLQAGLCYPRDMASTVSHGGFVSFALYVRNRGEKPLELNDFVRANPPRDDVRLAGWAPTVLDSRFQAVTVVHPPTNGQVFPRHRRLPPGEILLLGTVQLQIVAPSAESHKGIPSIKAPSGDYHVVQTYRFDTADSWTAWTGELTTGLLDMTVAAEKSSTDKTSAAASGASASTPAERERFYEKATAALKAVQDRVKNDAILKPLGKAKPPASAKDYLTLAVDTAESWPDFPTKSPSNSSDVQQGNGWLRINAYADLPQELPTTPFMPPKGCHWGNTYLIVPATAEKILVDTATSDPAAHRRLVEIVLDELHKAGIAAEAKDKEKIDSFPPADPAESAPPAPSGERPKASGRDQPSDKPTADTRLKALLDLPDAARHGSPEMAVAEILKRHLDPLRDDNAFDPLRDIDGKLKRPAARPLAVITWFLNRKQDTSLYYVTAEGEASDVLAQYDRGYKNLSSRKLSDKELSRLRTLLPKLPKSEGTPPIERAVVVSFERDKQWCTEFYDPSSLSAAFEEVMEVLQERPDTKNFRKPAARSDAPPDKPAEETRAGAAPLRHVKLSIGMKRAEAERLIAKASGTPSKYDLHAMDTSREVRYDDKLGTLVVRYKPGSPAPMIAVAGGGVRDLPPVDGEVLSWEYRPRAAAKGGGTSGTDKQPDKPAEERRLSVSLTLTKNQIVFVGPNNSAVSYTSTMSVPTKEAFVYGEPITVRFDVKNTSKEPVELWDRHCSPGCEVYHFEITRPDGSVNRVDEPMGLFGKNVPHTQTLEPGKTLSLEFDLAQLMSKPIPPGEFRVRGIYRSAALEGEESYQNAKELSGLWVGEVATEPVTFTLKPAIKAEGLARVAWLLTDSQDLGVMVVYPAARPLKADDLVSFFQTQQDGGAEPAHVPKLPLALGRVKKAYPWADMVFVEIKQENQFDELRIGDAVEKAGNAANETQWRKDYPWSVPAKQPENSATEKRLRFDFGPLHYEAVLARVPDKEYSTLRLKRLGSRLQSETHRFLLWNTDIRDDNNAKNPWPNAIEFKDGTLLVRGERFTRWLNPISGLDEKPVSHESASSQADLPAAKQRGETRAKTDIASGTLQILYYGKPWSTGKPLVDDESRLPVKIVEGCDVTAEFVAETDAYNAAMRLAAKDRAGKAPK